MMLRAMRERDNYCKQNGIDFYTPVYGDKALFIGASVKKS